MRVHVDHLHAAAADHDRAPPAHFGALCARSHVPLAARRCPREGPEPGLRVGEQLTPGKDDHVILLGVASSAGFLRQTSSAVTASTRVTFSISLTSTQASSSSALPRIVAGPYSRHGMPAFQRWHVSSAPYGSGSTVPMAFGPLTVTARAPPGSASVIGGG